MSFPTNIDSFTSPSSTDYLNSPAHATQHSNKNTAINAIETKVGTGASPASGAKDQYVMTADGAGGSAWERIAPVLTTATDGATVTFDLSVSNLQTVTLGGSRILALSNEQVGQCFVLRLVQDGGGNRTVTWFSTIKWPGAVTPTLTTTGGKTDVFGFIVTSAGNYDGFVIGQNL